MFVAHSFNEMRHFVSGMLPHKLHRGKEALNRLKVFEGVPTPYDRQKRKVVPVAMRVKCLKPRRKVCFMLNLSIAECA